MPNRNFYLIQHSYEQVLPKIEPVSACFFSQLFDLDASLRPIFPTERQRQMSLVRDTLTFVVQNLHRLDRLLLQAQTLGSDYATIGRQPRHYEALRTALLAALAEGAGESFTAEARVAWCELYNLLSNATLQAALRSNR